MSKFKDRDNDKECQFSDGGYNCHREAKFSVQLEKDGGWFNCCDQHVKMTAKKMSDHSEFIHTYKVKKIKKDG